MSFHEAYIAAGQLNILMHYAAGGDLAAQIKKAKTNRRPLEGPLITRWITQALLALQFMHSKHIIHRDIKPANMFLTSKGDLQLGDFGISKIMASTMACARTKVGTPYYLAPEVCQSRPYSGPCDIWSLGAVLFELMALRVPFEAHSMVQLVRKIVSGHLPAVPEIRGDPVRSSTN